MRQLTTTLLLALVIATIPAAANAGDVPEVVTSLAQAWLARHQTDLPGIDPVQAYASNFFFGYINPDGEIAMGSSLVKDAFAEGQAYWRAHPDERDSILSGFGYARVEVEGTWTRGFEISGFTPREGKGLWWVTPLARANWTGGRPDARDGQAQVRLSGYLSRPGQYGHMGMYSRELLVTAMRFSGAAPADR